MIVRRLILALALAGMLAGQMAAPCEADDAAGGPDLACMDLCAFTGSGASHVQLTSAHSTNAPACDCIHAVLPKTTTCRIASRPAPERFQASIGPTLIVPPPPAARRPESIPSHNPTPALSLEILRTTIIQS
jgi:hypothetical protein